MIYPQKYILNTSKCVNVVTFTFNCVIHSYFKVLTFVKRKVIEILKENKMKTLKIIVVGMILMLAGSVQGQVSVRLNIGTPPQWGPADYDDARYYYLPDIECYYDVPNSMFIYYSGNRWIHSRYLPGRYRNYDLYGGYKVVMNDYRGNRPYEHFREYRTRYARGYRGHEQRNIGVRYGDHGRGHEGVQSYRGGNRENNRGPQRNYNQNNGRGNYTAPVRIQERSHDRGNDRGQVRGNDRGHDNGNNRGQGRDRQDGKHD